MVTTQDDKEQYFRLNLQRITYSHENYFPFEVMYGH